MSWWIGVERVKGVVEYFQECFWIGVVFFDFGSDGDWVRVRGVEMEYREMLFRLETERSA